MCCDLIPYSCRIGFLQSTGMIFHQLIHAPIDMQAKRKQLDSIFPLNHNHRYIIGLVLCTDEVF